MYFERVLLSQSDSRISQVKNIPMLTNILKSCGVGDTINLHSSNLKNYFNLLFFSPVFKIIILMSLNTAVQLEVQFADNLHITVSISCQFIVILRNLDSISIKKECK